MCTHLIYLVQKTCGNTWNLKKCCFIKSVRDDCCSVGPPDWAWRCNSKIDSSQWSMIVVSFDPCNLLPTAHCCVAFPSLHSFILWLSKMFPCQNSIYISYVTHLGHFQYAQWGNMFHHLGSVIYFFHSFVFYIIPCNQETSFHIHTRYLEKLINGKVKQSQYIPG